MGLGGEKTVEVLLHGFSETLRWIAVIIILGAFIGEVLRDTGGALRISERIIRWVGARRLPWAMGLTGYVISIPVFVDVAYILLQPVVETLSVKSKKPVLFVGLALTAGLTVAHTLIPPTPGPLAVASLLDAEMGRMLVLNLFIAFCAMTGGILWVIFRVKNEWLAYDQKLGDQISSGSEEDAPQESQKSSLLRDVLPILVPIVLIGGGAFLTIDENSMVGGIFEFISMPLVAVLIGAGIAGLQVSGSNRRGKINDMVEQAIIKSALVIMITGAGGSLGFVIRESGIQDEIVGVFASFPFLGILLPFLVASLLTISTGSITVSLVGSASMLGPMVDSLPVSPEMVAGLIGCGSLCVFHANASFFWLLNRLHEVPPNVLYRTYTAQSLVMGMAGLIGVLCLYLLGF